MRSNRDILALDRSSPLVGASVLSADFARLGDEAAHAIAAGADMLHIDVMDGHFVPNLSMGPVVCEALRRALPDTFQDVHLMIEKPERYLDTFRAAGADHLTVHAEAIHRDRAPELAELIRQTGATAGLALKPSTPLDPWLDVLDRFDMVLVMSVEPGFSGQAFMHTTPARVIKVRDAVGPGPIVAVDGGLSPATAPLVVRAGADLIAAASAIFGAPYDHRSRVIEALRSASNTV